MLFMLSRRIFYTSGLVTKQTSLYKTFPDLLSQQKACTGSSKYKSLEFKISYSKKNVSNVINFKNIYFRLSYQDDGRHV